MTSIAYQPGQVITVHGGTLWNVSAGDSNQNSVVVGRLANPSLCFIIAVRHNDYDSIMVLAPGPIIGWLDVDSEKIFAAILEGSK